ncbi:MAG: hypothetical protein E7093_05665 [Bacteroidales bacterium]|nr:hypothetical protein [Bacteroidales bacterium]
MKMIGMKIIRHCLGKASHPFLMNCFLMLCVLVSCSGDSEFNGVSISLNKKELYLEVGKSERLTASFDPFDAPNQAHKWSSSDTHIATVDETGNVTAVNTGTAIVMAKALDGGSIAKCNVTVVEKVIPVSTISLDAAECEVAIGSRVTLNATIKPDNASNKNIKWESENIGIAIVDSEGNVDAVSVGVANINAVSEDGGKKATCKVSVVPKGVRFTLSEVENVTSNSALVTGCIKPVGVEVADMGICYGTNPNPTVNDVKISLSEESFSYRVGGLKPEETYYLRLYAIADGKTTYSNQTVFETLTAVSFSVPTFSDINSSSVVVKGSFNSNGSNLEEIGFVYSKKETPTIEDDKVSVSDEEFEYTLYDLETYTLYHVRLYAILDGRIIYSEQAEFTTAEELVTHFQESEVYEDKLVLISDAPQGYNSVNVCYGTAPNPTVTDNIGVAYKNSSNGKLVLKMSGLLYNKTYYLRSYYKQGNKFIYSDDEVEVSTIGEKNIRALNMTYSFCRIGSDYSNDFSFEAKFDIRTVLEGEFYWKAAGENYLSKSSTLTSSNKVKELYFEGNTQLIYQIIYHKSPYLYPTVTFYENPREIIHIPTGVKYYINVPSYDKEFETEDVPYKGYDK